MQPRSGVPELRVRSLNQHVARPDGDYVLYWMVANRRTRWNFSLQRAADWAAHLQKPLLVLEALRVGYEWASDRLHAFVIQGMADNQADFAKTAATYFPYLERNPGEGKGLLEALADKSCLVVTDDFPCFFLPRMIKSVAARLNVPIEAVDSNGIFPLRATDRVFARAFDFRRFLQKNLRPHLDEFPKANPLARMKIPTLDKLPSAVAKRWEVADVAKYSNCNALSEFSIDHSVGPAIMLGGSRAAVKNLKSFLDSRIETYGTLRSEPEKDVASGLSPYLHFGHISAHQVFSEATKREDWSTELISEKTTGSSSGWWGTTETTESFLDELITWREVGYNMCWQRDDYDQFESLPDWAQKTLREHANDHRPYVYEFEEFDESRTHDELWNAAQRQLVVEGKMHNYLRMLWGKKILEWSPTARDALDTMIELNNKYAVDGRNPNSYSGIFWVLGRYDRAWGPERPIFGKIRYMSSDNTARKFKVKNYIAKYGEQEQSRLF